ncbi:MAG TPA: tetratricopeptide repeat protein [Chloroflexota bacterium]|nr:tetratricopeptide repeat protein [Chloroflexota bacterium]
MAERLWALGIVKTSERDYARAAEALEESLALRRERGDAQGAAVSQATLGVVALNVGDLARARALLEEALETHRGRNDRWGQALVQAMLGHVELESGAVGRARELFGESAAGLQAIGNVLYLPWCLEGLVGVAAASGHAVRAARLCGAHEVLRERIGSAMLPLYPAGYERACATARAALSDADFAAAVAAGRSSPVEIVIAAALEPAGETAP